MDKTGLIEPVFTLGYYSAGKSKCQFTMLLAVCYLVCAAFSPVHADLRIVAWNTFNNPDNETEDSWFNIIFEAMDRIDILAVTETDTGSSVRLADVLSDTYENGHYDVVTSSSFGGDRTGLVYGPSTVTLLGSADLTTIGSHPIVRGEFRPVRYCWRVGLLYLCRPPEIRIIDQRQECAGRRGLEPPCQRRRSRCKASTSSTQATST